MAEYSGVDMAPRKDVTVTTYYVLRWAAPSPGFTVSGQELTGHFRYSGPPKRFATVAEVLEALARRSAARPANASDPFEIVRVTETVTQGAPEVSADLTVQSLADRYVIVDWGGKFWSALKPKGWSQSVDDAVYYQTEQEAVSGCVFLSGVTIRRVIPGKATTKVTEEVLK